MDFAKRKYELAEGAEVVLSLKSKKKDDCLFKMTPVTLGTGYDFYFIQLEFVQHVNSAYYDLENKNHSCMSVLQVI